jgi:hypothetical protein
MARPSSLVIGNPPTVPFWIASTAFAGRAEAAVAPGNGTASAETGLADRLRRLTDEARRLRRSARRRRGDVHRHLAAARRARAGGDDRITRDHVEAARRARHEAGKSERFAEVCERRARAMVMSLLHRCSDVPVDG